MRHSSNSADIGIQRHFSTISHQFFNAIEKFAIFSIDHLGECLLTGQFMIEFCECILKSSTDFSLTTGSGFVPEINVSMIVITFRNGSSVKSSANDVVAANFAISSFTAAEFEQRATFVPIDRKCVSIRGVGLSIFRFFQLSII